MQRMLLDVPDGVSHSRPLSLDEARARLRELQGSWAYAFAMGHGCSIGPDPDSASVRREVADLAAIIAEHTPRQPAR